MDGIHDLGGMHGFGPIEREEDEPVFHAAWEKVVRAVAEAIGVNGLQTAAEFRHGIERMDPLHYLAASYYERWLFTVERHLVETGVVTERELDRSMTLLRNNPTMPLPHREDPELVHRLRVALFGPRAPRTGGAQPRFAVGDRVVTRNIHPIGHTRLPRYARGKRGVVRGLHGVASCPDEDFEGRGAGLEQVYSIGFASRELWGDTADPRSDVYLDVWERYVVLDAAATRDLPAAAHT
jgi:nitrile hydratase beta subunit